MFRTCCVALIVLPLACGVLGAQGPQPADDLTAFEQRLAVAIAEKALTQKGLVNPRERAFLLGKGAAGEKDKMYVTDRELLRPKGEEKDRKAVVTFYRYRDDLTIQATVDLTNQQTIKIDSASHQGTRLADEEVALAAKLVRADPQVKKLLGERVEIGRMVPHLPPSKDDPARGRRLVRVTFRADGDFVAWPRATVDLTTQTVTVETAKPD